MAIQFPAGPFIGDTFPYEGMIYTYDGEKWTAATDKAYWDKTGDDLTPKEPGDNVDLGTGDLSANNAEFDGKVNVGGTWPASETSEIRAGAYFGRNDTSSATAFEIYSGGTDAASRKIKFTAGGNATFSGDLKSLSQSRMNLKVWFSQDWPII